jgi:uncharacterized lipoprotein NlpE involved in copper resistance
MFNLTYIYMKKLYVAGLVSISLLTFSCSNDEDGIEVQEVKVLDFKTTPQSVLESDFTARTSDSTRVRSSTDVIDADGDPSVLKPPR